MPHIFTIGHSSHPIDTFPALLAGAPKPFYARQTLFSVAARRPGSAKYGAGAQARMKFEMMILNVTPHVTWLALWLCVLAFWW